MSHAALFLNTKDYNDRRKKLRLSATKAEKVLWQELKDKKLGYKFRRQFQIKRYIVDFYCRELRLIIELDGPIHQYQQKYDKLRTKNLEKLGLLVVRYLNDQVLFEREKVLSELQMLCAKRALLFQPSTPPDLPHGGRDAPN